MNVSPALKSVRRFNSGPIMATASLYLDQEKIGLVTFSKLNFSEEDFQIFTFKNTGASAIWESYCSYMKIANPEWHAGVLFKNILGR
jgi:hypothetical protein